jgi:hypothetical protein
MDKCSQILCFVCRFDGKNGKTIRPLTLWKKPNGDLFWDWKALPTPRPLYHLDRLAANPDARVLVVEGEKTAEAAARLFPDFVITTSPNGANAASKADWSPLKDRQIVIWPDNDKPGHTYAASVCRLAREAGASRITVVKVPSNFPPNWDLADPLPEGYVMDDLRRLTDEALEPSNDQLEAVTTIPIKWFQNITPMVSGIDLIEGFMGVGQSSVIFGAANSSKTFLALDLALHIASGRPWFGRQVEPGGVIFVAAEGSFGISNRIEAFRRHHGIGPDVALPFAIVTSCPNLGSLPNDTKAMIATIQEASAEINGPVRLVVIDTLSRALAGGNENSSDDMGAIVTNADRIREETGAHVMFIHHSGKDATRGARGHSLLRAAIDTEIEVTRNETRGISCARITKQREFPIEDELVYRLEVVDLGVNPRGQPVTSCVAIPVNDEIDRSRAGQDRTISSGADRALSALRDCIAKHGQIVEAVPDVPPLLAVKQQEWHEELRKVGITDESKPDSERSLRSRYRKELVKSGIIGIFGDFVWLNGRDRIEVDEISGGPSEMKRDETPPVGGVSSRSQVTGVVSGNQSQQQSAAVPQGRSPYLPPPLLPPAFPPQAQPLRPLARWDETMHGRSKPLAVGNPPSAMPKPAENLPSSGMADKSGGISDDIDL